MQIALVDESEDQLETFTLILEECFPKDSNIEIVGHMPTPNVIDMSFLVQSPNIVALILDEQLKDSGVANYLGIDLAIYLRSLNRKIPIYILTSYPDSDELLTSEFTVEDILNKQDLPQRKDIVGARILRRIDSFLDVSSTREIEFESLLRKSLEGTLTIEEETKFIELGYLRSAAFEVDEIFSRQKLEFLDSLEAKINKLNSDLSQKK